ncbi:hypothetical protein EM6_3277 (plasmid) [Asticcacaulis excentricus]|uniref:Uncharacterized protein n=2 Tax=Asticcacaulis excentricus TaxID=78587 RepID=A0A3G9G7J2_9CAUL|nr:hypothetical protein EM6_3277 [Asticcacaulis excentricus]
MKNAPSSTLEDPENIPNHLSDSAGIALFAKLESFSTAALNNCLALTNAEVRYRCLHELILRRAITIDTAKTFMKDSNVKTRFEALIEAERLGLIVSEDEAKKVIIKSEPKRSGLLSSSSNPTPEEERWWNAYRHQKLCMHAEADLINSLKPDSLHSWETELALYDAYFRTHSAELRANLADGFKGALENKFEAHTKTFSNLGLDHFSTSKNLLSFIGTGLVSDGLTILCRHGSNADLPLVRKCVDSFEPYSSIELLRFLAKFGEWEDIERVVKIVGKTDPRYYGLFSNNDDNYDLAAKIVCKLATRRTIDLFNSSISPYIMTKILKFISNRDFLSLTDEHLLKMFSNESDNLRRMVALKCVQHLPKTRLSALLERYQVNGEYRYYNVIHWLDLGVSMPSDVARTVAKRASS